MMGGSDVLLDGNGSDQAGNSEKNMLIRCLGAFGGMLLLGGAATTFNGSVPLSNRQELVVGGRQGYPTAWICTIGSASQECRLVKVVS